MVLRRGSRAGFERSAKGRQRLFRDGSPTISERGRSPADDKGLRHPHLLAIGCETDNLFPGIRGDGGAIDFFRERGWRGGLIQPVATLAGPTNQLATWPAHRSPASTFCCRWPGSPERCYRSCAPLMMTSSPS